jgi:ABC-type nickel/cobalt efflux system permease component RcnA
MSPPNTANWIRLGLLALPLLGLLTFWTTLDPQLEPGFAVYAQGAATFMLAILLLFVGNVLLGVAVWRSGTLPRWAGAIWVASAVLMYPLGIVIAMRITGSTPRTVLVGAVLIAISGGWIAWRVMRQPSSQVVGAEAQSRVQ